MRSRTCLLVSEDPDDQLEFSEALNEISSDTILIIVVHAEKAMELLIKKLHVPDFIFFDLSVNGIQPDIFFSALQNDPMLERIPLVVYGDYSQYDEVKTDGISTFLNRECTYSDLRIFLEKIVKG